MPPPADRYSTANGGFDARLARLNAATTALPPYLAAKAQYDPAKDQ